MQRMDRRKLLKIMASLPLLMTYQSLSKTENRNYDNSVLNELKKAQIVWEKSEKCCPIQFINKLSISVINDQTLLRAQISNEFKKNEVVDINGLIVSKTEAALLASLSSVLNKT